MGSLLSSKEVYMSMGETFAAANDSAAEEFYSFNTNMTSPPMCIGIDECESSNEFHFEYSPATTPPISMLLLVEPSPFTYVSGYANRFQYMLQYLQSTGDTVEIITAEAVVSDPPSKYIGFPIHYTRGIKFPLYRTVSISLDYTFKIPRVIHRMRPDIIHVSSPGFMCIGAVLYSQLFQIPLVISYHTHIPIYLQSYVPKCLFGLVENILWILIRKFHSMADLNLVTSPQILWDFISRGVPKCYVWQKGIDSEQFHPKHSSYSMRYAMSNGNVDDYLILYVGRLAAEKRVADLKDILEGLLKHNPNNHGCCRLCIVGTGPQEDELRNKTFYQHPAVVFMGVLVGEELSQAYASADVFVLPSDSETLGFVVLEAMASSVPVVAARAGGIPDMIQDGETSFLVTPGNTTEYVERLDLLKQNEYLRRRMGEKARQYTEQWTWQSSMSKLRDVQYKQAIANFQQRWSVRFKIWIGRLFQRIILAVKTRTRTHTKST